MFGYIISGILAVYGLVVFLMPKYMVRSEQRDDPEALAQGRKIGLLIIVFAIGAALLMMKYEAF